MVAYPSDDTCIILPKKLLDDVEFDPYTRKYQDCGSKDACGDGQFRIR